jgi:hypothetical protein
MQNEYVISESSRNEILSVLYRYPMGEIEGVVTFLRNLTPIQKEEEKEDA